ncbi:MAG: putative CRISPR-associated protein [Thermofilaceae archaeon]|nr:putative CRISPR-associated protein [Thermofilaceae archaeon]MCX8179984.1 putative CRISPR-associated protein [Thermofilaceae archaeon]MDW8004711.1 putative CRISPR-associated protein [Thermofilaceae archaeon]
MREAHIVSVGTSIIRNSAQRAALPAEVTNVLKKWSVAQPGSPEDVEAGEKCVPGHPIFKVLLDQLATEPRIVSAELNAMWTYLDRGSVESVELLASDSGVCELCAKLLKEYLSNQFKVKVEVHRIPGLGRHFEDGLYNLLDKISVLIKRHKREAREVYLNATGGFKPETAMMYTAACLFGADRVYYIHEVMRDVVELPALPLSVPSDYIAAAGFVRTKGEVPERYSRIVEELEKKGVVYRVGKSYRLRRWASILLEQH